MWLLILALISAFLYLSSALYEICKVAIFCFSTLTPSKGSVNNRITDSYIALIVNGGAEGHRDSLCRFN